MFFVGILSFTLMLVWVVQTVLAGLLSHIYIDAVDDWLACIRFDFARRNAAGEQWEELLVANSEGRLCPAAPQGTTLFESQVLRSLFEVLMPGMVAITFSFRVVHVDGRLLLQMSRATGTSAAVVAVAPLPFDSKAHDVPSGRQGSVRSRPDESGGVCHSAFLEQAKSGLGASKNEILASLPPKPEEPDGRNVVMGPSASRASFLSGARERARYAWDGPKHKSQARLAQL
jgi:hypothetical protein